MKFLLNLLKAMAVTAAVMGAFLLAPFIVPLAIGGGVFTLAYIVFSESKSEGED